jgi:circadian clock protein KaiC
MTHPTDAAGASTRSPPPRVSSGVIGLDEVLGGGLPAGHIYLIEGDAGAGKTTIGLQFLLDGLSAGESCLWITMSETERELNSAADSHGWDISAIQVVNLSISQTALKDEEKYSFFSPADVELTDTTRVILEAVERLRPTRVVFDPFSDIRHLARDVLTYRRQILALRDYFVEKGCTVLLMQEMTRGLGGDSQAEALVHGYMTLHQDSPEYGGQRRRLRVHKMRGIAFRDGYHDFAIHAGGLRVYPRLIAAEHFDELPEEIISSGNQELDTLLGGGAERGSSLLIMGAAGVGKSTLASSYASAAAGRGEKVLFFMFDENIRAYKSRNVKLQTSIEQHIEGGLLHLRQVDSAEFSPGGFAHLVMDAVDREKVRMVVIDSLSGYLSAMPEERFLSTHVHELLTYLSYRNVVTILTLAQHGVMGENVQSPVDLSYLADTVLLLRYFEAHGSVRRALSVVKKRSGPHEVSIREMLIRAPGGIVVGEPLVQFQGVLSGRPAFVGDEPQLGALPPHR